MSPPDAEVTELPSSPGARLRREREGRGLTQQQAAESLNLDPTVVTYLEANDFAALGAPVFVKGHLRRYAQLVGLNEDELLATYERSKQQIDEPTLVPKSRLEMAPVRNQPRWPWVIGGAVAFFLGSALIAYVSKHGLPWTGSTPEAEPTATTVDTPAATAQVAATPPATAPTAGDAAVPPTATAGVAAATVAGANAAKPGTTAAGVAPGTAPFTSSAAPAGASSAQPNGAPGAATAPGTAVGAAPAATAATATASPPVAVQPGQVSLQLRFSADSWVEVFDGTGKAVLYDLGKAGTERTLVASAPLSVTLGDARGVAVVVNGRTLPPPRTEGQVLARFGVTADGSLR